MGVTVTIKDQRASGKALGEVELSDVAEPVTLRALLESRIGAEVAAYNAEPGRYYHGFVAPEGSFPEPRGYLMLEPRPLDAQKQLEAAARSFVGKAFRVLVDGAVVEGYDEVLSVGDEADIRFVKLTPIVGG